MKGFSKKTRLLAPWRRSLQTVAALAFFLLPFGRLGGRPLLRLDVEALTLHFFGLTLRVTELTLFLFLAGAGLFLLLLLTIILGRVWCGWGCPQTTLSDLAEALLHRLERWGLAGKIFFHLLLGLMGLLVGAVLVWYFVAPAEYFERLLAGRLNGWPLGTTLVTALIVYLDAAFVRRLLCREFCPYGRFQTTLVDPGTLTLRFHPDEAARCIDCQACLRACPMGIDIRRGFQVECINCAACLDACRTVMAKRRQPGIIRYTFGAGPAGWRALLSPRLGLVALVFLLLSGAFLYSALHRPEASLKVRRLAEAAPRSMADGRTAVFYEAYLENRTEGEHTVALSAFQAKDAEPVELQGQTRRLLLAPGGRRKVTFTVLGEAVRPAPLSLELVLTDENGRPLAKASATLPASN